MRLKDVRFFSYFSKEPIIPVRCEFNATDAEIKTPNNQRVNINETRTTYGLASVLVELNVNVDFE